MAAIMPTPTSQQNDGSWFDNTSIEDKLVLSPIIVRAKLLKIIKRKKNIRGKSSKVIGK